MVGGTGERPAKANLTSLGFRRLDGPPLWSACARLASECSTTKAHTDLPAVPEIARVRCQCLCLECGAVRIVVGVCAVQRQDNRVCVAFYAKRFRVKDKTARPDTPDPASALVICHRFRYSEATACMWT
jgi:hypothetical protein